ncbi:MAG: YybH family protein [Chitinophagaceae bacterium]
MTPKRLPSKVTATVYFFLILLISCKESNNEQTEEDSIKKVLTSMWDAIEKKDIDRYASYIHPDFTQFGETDSVLREGKEAEVKGIAEWMKHTSNVHTEMHDPKITVKNIVAWITYYWSDGGSNDGKPFTSSGKSTRIFLKENNQWLCIHGHYTLLP